LTLAWAPTGQYLAAGNSDLIQIWHSNALASPRGIRGSEALLTWRAPAAVDGALPSSSPSTSTAAAGQSSALESGMKASLPVNGEPNGVSEHDHAKLESEPSLSWSADGESLALAADKQVSSHLVHDKCLRFYDIQSFVHFDHDGSVSLQPRAS
jgi:hypothetical protein